MKHRFTGLAVEQVHHFSSLKRFAALSAAAAILLLATSCTATNSHEASSAAVIPTSTPAASLGAISATAVPVPPSGSGSHEINPNPLADTGPEQVTYPIDAYQFSYLQQAQLQYLEAFLIHRCMGELGFDFSSITVSPSTYYTAYVKDHVEANSREWGITDLQVAQKYGYELPPWVDGPDAPITIGSLPAPEVLALTGRSPNKGGAASTPTSSSKIPAGGCENQAFQILASAGITQDQTDLSLISQIGSNSFFAARADPTVTAVFAKWSACMLASRYKYSDPFTAAGSFATSSKVTLKQVHVAVTDIHCQHKVNELGVASAVEARDQIKLMGQHAEQLSHYETYLKQQGQILARLLQLYKITSGT